MITNLESLIPPALQNQEVHLWWACLETFQPTDEQWALLSQDEQDRAWRFKRDCDRNRYVLARSTLRHLLSLYTKIPATEISFCYGCKGKPALDAEGVDDPLEFNVSHSHHLVLLGFGREAIGVDVEYIKPEFQAARLAQRFFTRREYEVLRQLPVEQQRQLFFRLWTRKESCIKATGESLFEKIGQVEVPCDDDGRSAGVRVGQQLLQVQDVSLHPRYCAAIASPAQGVRISCFEI